MDSLRRRRISRQVLHVVGEPMYATSDTHDKHGIQPKMLTRFWDKGRGVRVCGADAW